MQFSIIAVNVKTKTKIAKADPKDERVGEGKMPGLRYPNSQLRSNEGIFEGFARVLISCSKCTIENTCIS